jgi:hypothetical protein
MVILLKCVFFDCKGVDHFINKHYCFLDCISFRYQRNDVEAYRCVLSLSGTLEVKALIQRSPNRIEAAVYIDKEVTERVFLKVVTMVTKFKT